MKFSKKLATCAFALILAIALPFSVFAEETRLPRFAGVTSITTELSFGSGTAACKANVKGTANTTSITCSLTLISNGKVIAGWVETDSGNSLIMSKNIAITSKGSYTLECDVTDTTNGKVYNEATVSSTKIYS
ncbi:hypothetical protein FACS1894120_4490 [Clostridia bacterium]|nr:hypothetical protein FACS1894120_4490 [Clostridia bacterium]